MGQRIPQDHFVPGGRVDARAAALDHEGVAAKMVGMAVRRDDRANAVDRRLQIAQHLAGSGVVQAGVDQDGLVVRRRE